jgi:hypothetical protein
VSGIDFALGTDSSGWTWVNARSDLWPKRGEWQTATMSTLWQDDPRTDAELLAAYCVPAPECGAGWHAFPPVAEGEPRGIPRRAADQAGLIRACLLTGVRPSDVLSSQTIVRLVLKVAELDRALAHGGG